MFVKLPRASNNYTAGPTTAIVRTIARYLCLMAFRCTFRCKSLPAFAAVMFGGQGVDFGFQMVSVIAIVFATFVAEWHRGECQRAIVFGCLDTNLMGRKPWISGLSALFRPPILMRMRILELPIIYPLHRHKTRKYAQLVNGPAEDVLIHVSTYIMLI